MTLSENINLLQQIITTKRDGYVIKFEEVLESIIATNDPKSIVELVAFFDDNCEYEELMFSIIHTIENHSMDVYCQEILKAAPLLYSKSPRWGKTIFIRIINSSNALSKFKSALELATDEQKKTILSIMKDINQESDQFSEKTSIVVKYLKDA